MTRDPATVRPSTSIGDAATLMVRKRCRHLLRLATARVVGGDLAGLVDAVWRSGHRVLSVVRW